MRQCDDVPFAAKLMWRSSVLTLLFCRFVFFILVVSTFQYFNWWGVFCFCGCFRICVCISVHQSVTSSMLHHHFTDIIVCINQWGSEFVKVGSGNSCCSVRTKPRRLGKIKSILPRSTWDLCINLFHYYYFFRHERQKCEEHVKRDLLTVIKI